MNMSYFNQFKLMKLLYMKSSETMMSISNLTMTLMSMIIFMMMTQKESTVLPTRITIMTKKMMQNMNDLTNEHMKSKHKTYTPLMTNMFMMLLFMNITGLLPYMFTTTSHIMITFSLSLCIMIKTTMSSTTKHHSKFFSMFTPHSAPLMLTPFLMMMETMSYTTRTISLGVRLAANMTAGHLLITILSSFTLNMMLSNYYLLSMMPMIMFTLISLLEMMVALMQAYVFTLLTTMYLSDTVKLH